MCKNSSYYALWLVKNYSRDLQHPIRAISDWQSMLCWHSCMTLAHAYWVNGREYSRKLLPFVKPTFGILLEHHQVLPTKYIGNSTVASSQLSQFLLSSSANNWGCNNRSNNNNSSNNKNKRQQQQQQQQKFKKINRNLKSLFPKNIFLTNQVLLQFFSFFKLHCNPNSFSWSHQCLWTLKPANSMQISNIKSDDCNRK